MKYVLKLETESKGFFVMDKLNALYHYLYRTGPKDEVLHFIRCMLNKSESPLYLLIEDGCFLHLLAEEYLDDSSLPIHTITGEEGIRYFFDLDGTVAEWNKEASMEEVFSPSYFRDRPVMEMVQKTMELLSKTKEIFVISAYNPEFQHVLSDKITWCDRHVPFVKEANRLFTKIGDKKSDYVPFPKDTDVLIDDYHVNLKEWHGISIKMLNDVNSPWDGRMVYHKAKPESMAKMIELLGQK